MPRSRSISLIGAIGPFVGWEALLGHSSAEHGAGATEALP